ncbi:MAG TPA: hypothetical protein VGG84_10315 [Gemmatimonadaceae bacterium]|jgi:hypothetical protein
MYATAASSADLAHRYDYHAPTAEAVALHEQLRGRCLMLADLFDQQLPPSREKSLAQTNLEDALMWANAAVARHISSTPPAQVAP